MTLASSPVALTPGPVAPLAKTARRRIERRWLRALPVAVIVVVALVGPLVVPFDPTHVSGPPYQAPGGRFLFGTDSSGLDVFSRVVVATRTDLLIGLAVMAISTVLGVLLGLALGMNDAHRGWTGTVARTTSRAVDLIQAVPFLVTVLVVLSLWGTTPTSLIVVVALLISPIQMRLTRTETLRVRGDAYLDASRMAGLSETRIALRNVLPNATRPALENSTVMFAAGIVATAGLGFLGVGLAPPAAEWGTMISSGAPDILLGRWWEATFSALALGLTVASVVFFSTAFLRGKRATH